MLFFIVVMLAVLYFFFIYIPKMILFGPDSCIREQDKKNDEEAAIRVKKQNEYDDYWGYIKK